MKNISGSSIETTDVLIDGKVYSLSGEDPAYAQKVAAYMNLKLADVRSVPGYRNLDAAYKEMLLNINIADDYFKAAEETKTVKASAEQLEKELYAVRHDLVSAKLKLEASLKQQNVLENRAREWEQRYNELKSLKDRT